MTCINSDVRDCFQNADFAKYILKKHQFLKTVMVHGNISVNFGLIAGAVSKCNKVKCSDTLGGKYNMQLLQIISSLPEAIWKRMF